MESISKFGRCSGLKPNLNKSQVFFGNTPQSIRDWFKEQYNVPQGQLPVRFLGVPLISSMLSINDCTTLIQKVRKKMGSWTSKFLSYGGRLVLIKTTIFAIQSFWSAHFILPTSVLQTIDKIMKRFLWKGSEERGGAKVAWSTICLPKSQGGLDFKDTKSWNKAQIMHHLWQVIRQKSSSLWATWVNTSVLKQKNFWTVAIPADCSWIWRKVLALRNEARPFICYSIGNGNRTSLWFDPWYNHTNLSTDPSSVMIAQSGISATAKVSNIISNHRWTLPCLDQVRHTDASLINWIASFDYSIPIDPTKEDSISWNGTKEGKVTARTIWLDLRIEADKVDWYPIVWNKMKINRYTFFSWLAMHGRLPTLERLSSFGMNVSKQCFLCIDAAESQQHLFITCSYSRYVLAKLFDIITTASLPLTWSEMVTFLLSLAMPHREIAFTAFQIFIYHVWRERNARMHDRKSFNPGKLLKAIILDLRSRATSSSWFIKQTIRYPLLQYWIL